MASAAVEETPQTNAAETEQPALPTRSWRKKYRKLRQRFARVMNDSNVLTKEDNRAYALARRLQEENEQLLEILHEMHTSPQMQFDRRIDFASIDRTSESPSLTNASTAESENDESLLSSLLTMSHRKYDINDIPDELLHESPSNYMDVLYLHEYVQNLDEQLENHPDEDPYEVLNDPNRVIRPTPSRVVATEKELILKNSDSVISWLRRHHPETFIQDKDPDKEKSESKKRSSGKRASVAAPKKEPEELLDDDVDTLLELPIPEKAVKTKRSKDDEPYRPKGGSSKSSKRKRVEDGEGKAAARGKRAKA